MKHISFFLYDPQSEVQLSTCYESLYPSWKKVGNFYTASGWRGFWYLYKNPSKYRRCEYEDPDGSPSWSGRNGYSPEVWSMNLFTFSYLKGSFHKTDRPSKVVVITRTIILVLTLQIFLYHESVHILFLLERGFFVHEKGFLRASSLQK